MDHSINTQYIRGEDRQSKVNMHRYILGGKRIQQGSLQHSTVDFQRWSGFSFVFFIPDLRKVEYWQSFDGGKMVGGGHVDRLHCVKFLQD